MVLAFQIGILYDTNFLGSIELFEFTKMGLGTPVKILIAVVVVIFFILSYVNEAIC